MASPALRSLLLLLAIGSIALSSPELTLTAVLVDQKYCYTDAEIFQVILTLEGRFTNVSNGNVVLARRVEAGLATVAKTSEAGERGIFEFDPLNRGTHISRGEEPRPAFGSKPDRKRFVILSPGESYEAPLEGLVVVRYPALDPSRAAFAVSPGSHVAQLKVDTFPDRWLMGEDEIQRLRKRWSPFGALSVAFVKSNFVPFSIPWNAKVEDCSIRRSRRPQR